jgi:hypothetical protein
MTKLDKILCALIYLLITATWFTLAVPMLLQMDTQVAHWIAYGFSAFWIGLTLYIYWLITFRASRPA